MKRNFFFAIVCFSAIIITGCSNEGKIIDIERGEKVHTNGSSDNFTFFTSSVTYQLLPDDKKGILAEDYIIDSPKGINIDSVAMDVVVKRVTASDSSYDAYNINADVFLSISNDLPEGQYVVSISFPNVLTIRDIIGATKPVETPKIIFTIRVYESLENLANAKWRSNFLLATLLVGLSILGIKINNEYTMLFGYGAGLASLYFIFQSVRFIWMLSPWTSILIGLNLAISLKAAYQKL